MNHKEYRDLVTDLKRGCWVLLIQVVVSMIIVGIMIYKN
jgi:hypothetical protein